MDTSDALVPFDRRRLPRRMRSTAEKRRIVEETLVSGVSVAEVARRHGVNTNLLFNWKDLHRRGLLDQCREPARLAPVTIASSRALMPESAVTPYTPDGVIEIDLGDQARIRVRGQVDVETLTAALRALRR